MRRFGSNEAKQAATTQVLCDVDHSSHVAYITLNRPDKRNALSVPMRYRMTDLLHELEDDPEVRVIVFRGTGPSFSSGAEINEDWGQRGKHKRFTVEQAYLYSAEMTWGRGGFGQAIARCPKVTIAQLHGYCAAASYFLLASRCDLLVAESGARIGALEARFMGPAAATASLHLVRILGTKGANFTGYTGEAMTAARANNLGLIQKVVPEGELEAAVDRLARDIGARSTGELLFLKARIRFGESILHANVPVVTGLLMSHFLRRESDEHDFFSTVQRGGVKEALMEERRRHGADE